MKHRRRELIELTETLRQEVRKMLETCMITLNVGIFLKYGLKGLPQLFFERSLFARYLQKKPVQSYYDAMLGSDKV